MADEDLRWCDVCDDCSHYKAVGDEKYQCTLEGGRCRGYFAYKKLKAENAALKERLDKAIELPSVREITVNTNGKPIIIYEAVYLNKYGCVMKNLYYNDKESAEARLAKLKGR